MLGQTLIQQKKMQWAKEREEMMGLCGLWSQAPVKSSESRRSSLLPPIQMKHEDINAEESETSGYTSDSPLHDNTKAHKQEQNEWRAMRCDPLTPDTPDDRPRWGDRGVAIGHLWEPIPELPNARLPQVLESYRCTPRWVERGLGLSDGSKADILEIHHEDESGPPSSKFLLGQNVPLPPDVLEERERKRKKALEHQNAIRRQLDERDKMRKEEKERRLREERLEEERILKEREWERRRHDQEAELQKRKRNQEEMEHEKMKNAINTAERRAREDRDHKRKKAELERVNVIINSSRSTKDSSCQADSKDTKDASSQCDGGLALVLDGGPGLALLMPQPRVLAHATTQTHREPTVCSNSSRSDMSDKSLSGAYNPSMSFSKHRTGRQLQSSLRDRPKWGINRPTVQYRKQSEKDPHYTKRARRRAKRQRGSPVQLRSEHCLLPANTDDDFDEKPVGCSKSMTCEDEKPKHFVFFEKENTVNGSKFITTEDKKPIESNNSMFIENTQLADYSTSINYNYENPAIFDKMAFFEGEKLDSPELKPSDDEKHMDSSQSISSHSEKLVTPEQTDTSNLSNFALENGFRMNSGESSPRFVPIKKAGHDATDCLETELCNDNDSGDIEKECDWIREDLEDSGSLCEGENNDDDDSVVLQPDVIARIAALKVSLCRLSDENNSERTSPSSSLLSLDSAPTPR